MTANESIDHRALVLELLRRARVAGADAADTLIGEGREFSATVRRGEIETLKEAGSRALGLRVFVGKRTANAYTSDLTLASLESFVRDTVDMARATGEDPAAGLPEDVSPAEDLDLGLYDPSPAALPTADRIEWARRAEHAALHAFPEITNSQGASYSSSEGRIVLANTLGFLGEYRSSTASMSVVPVAEYQGQMECDYWYTSGRGLSELLSPEEVGRIAAERTVRRLGARKVPTCQVPVVFDPETAAALLSDLLGAISGYSVFRNATFLKGCLGQAVASPLLAVVDDARRYRGLGSRPFDGEGLPTRRNVPIDDGVLRLFLCDSYAARKIDAQSTGSARRGVVGSPSVGASNLYIAAGATPAEQIVAEVDRGLFLTDLIGFGVDLVSGDYSKGATGHWIEGGRLVHPVHEVTIAGNLKQMLHDIDAIGTDLEFRGPVSAPTLRIRSMTVAGL